MPDIASVNAGEAATLSDNPLRLPWKSWADDGGVVNCDRMFVFLECSKEYREFIVQAVNAYHDHLKRIAELEEENDDLLKQLRHFDREATGIDD